MPHDVFISFKNSDENGCQTKDSEIANKLYDFLTDKGLRVFFSNVELEFTGKAQYTKVIDDALDTSRFLIAVGSNHNNLNSQWVRYEWESFLNDIRSGIKPNAEVFVLISDMRINDLPRALRQQQAFNADDKNSYEKLYRFIKNAMGMPVIEKPKSPPNITDGRSNNVTNVSVKGGNSSVVNKDTNLYATTMGNIMNGSRCACKDGYLYVVSSSNRIRRIDIKDNTETPFSDVDADKVCILDNYLYVSNARLTDSGIFRIPVSDTNKVEKICNDRIGTMIVTGNAIFYQSFNNAGIYKMNPDGSNVVKLCSEYGIAGILLNATYLYFTKDYELYRMLLDGSEKIKLTSADDYKINFITLSGENIFFNKSPEIVADRTFFKAGLFKANLDCQDVVKITDETVFKFNAIEDYVYYNTIVYSSGKDCFYRINRDGTNKIVLNEGIPIEGIYEFDEKVYYHDISMKINCLDLRKNDAGRDTTELNTTNTYNAANGGKMLQNGKEVYYSKGDGILYKTEIGKDDSDRVAIYRSEKRNPIGHINSNGNTLYFYETGKGICEIKTDGTAFRLLESFADVSEIWGKVTSGIAPQQMILLGDILFVQFTMSYNGDGADFNRLYMFNKSTREKQRISRDDERIEWITAYNGFLYFVVRDDFNGGSVMRIRQGSTEREKVIANLHAKSILVDDDFIYYFRLDDAFMYRVKHDGTGKEKISVDRGDTYFSMDSEWVYYRDGWGKHRGNTKIYAFNKANSENKEFAAGDIDDYYGFYVIGNQLYYLDEGIMSKKPLLFQ